MEVLDYKPHVIESYKFLLGIWTSMSEGLLKKFFLKKNFFFFLMGSPQKFLAVLLAFCKIWRNLLKSRFSHNFKSLYRALECSYGAETMWNRKSAKNRIFLHWQPLSYDHLIGFILSQNENFQFSKKKIFQIFFEI